MRKKWTIFSLVILLLQTFSPVVAIAETTKKMVSTSGSASITEFLVEEAESVDPTNVVSIIKGSVSEETSQTKQIKLTGLTSTAAGAIVNSQQAPIGNYQATGETLTLKFNEGLKGNYQVKLTGALVNQVTKDQILTVSLAEQAVSTTVSLKQADVTTITAATEGTEPTSASTSDTTNATEGEKTTTDSSQSPKGVAAIETKASREPIDIASLFEEGTSFFTGVSIVDQAGNVVTDPTIKLDEALSVALSFAIPESVRSQMQSGDYYDVQLPAEVVIKTPITFELIGKDGNYGMVTIGTDGKMRIVFNEEVEQQSVISGTVQVDGSLGKGNMEGPGENNLEFPFIEEEPGLPIWVTPQAEKEIRKEGHPDRQTNPNEIVWDVDINLGLHALTNAKVTEKFPAGTTYKSVTVYQAKVGFDGVIIPGEFEEVSSGFSVDAEGNVSFEGVITSAYRLEYVTTIDEEAKPGDEGGSVSYLNNATLAADELADSETTAEITAHYKGKLIKEQPEYDPSTQEFKWTVHYNHNESTIQPEKAAITDTFTGNMLLKDDSVVIYKISFDENNNPLQGEALQAGIDYTLIPNPAGDGFLVNFVKGLDYAVDIHYTTVIAEEVTGSQVYGNQVVDGEKHQDGSTGQAEQQGLIKNLIDSDYNAKTLSWEILVNQNEYDLINWTMTDTLSPGLELALGTRSFVISDTTTGSLLERDIDYSFVYDEKARTLVIKFIGAYERTNHKFKINYKTNFDTAELNEAGLNVFKNNAQSNWSNQNGDELTSQDEEIFVPKPEEGADGFKYGNYNAQTKTITWTVGINYNRQDLGDVKITDPITSNQNFVKGSLKGFTYTISKEGEIVKGARLPANRFTFTEPATTNANTLGISIPKVGATDQIYFEFETSLKDEIVNTSSSYHNEATVSASKVTGDFSIQGDVSIANGGTHIKKTGKQEQDGFLHWSATINPSQSAVYDAVVTDRPSPNQSIDPSSIVVYNTTVTPTGKISQGEAQDVSAYTISLSTDQETGQQELIITFTAEKIERAYILAYRAMVMLEKPAGETASNSIKLEGTNKEAGEWETNKELEVSASGGGGTAVGEAGSLTIRKVDETAQVLTGATFQLWDKNNQQVLREGDVTPSGTLSFKKLPYGDYLLKEINAPTGHTIPDDLVAGRAVKISKATSASGYYLDIVNEPNKVVLKKQAEDGTALSGAKFKLEILTKGQWVLVPTSSNLTTDTAGNLTVTGLLAGNYRFTEVSAPVTPQEYMLDTTPIEFEVVTTAQGQTPVVKVGPVINYLGSASFIKVDGKDERKTLAGATFKIKRVKNGSGVSINEPLAATYTADKNGKVTMTKLSPGEYAVTEVNAPTGYILNTEATKFTIPSQTTGKPVELLAPNFKNYLGSLSFIKQGVTDKEGTNPLAGAEFAIKSATGQLVKTASSDAAGKVTVDDLAPGKYTLKETKAAPGYILNTEEVAFEIVSEAAGVPSVLQLADFFNYKGSIQLAKVNSKGEHLPGAVFDLFTKADRLNEKSLGSYESDANGLITIKDIAPGSYKLVETKAPTLSNGSSYIKNVYPRFFEIKSAQKGDVPLLKIGEYQNFTGKVTITKKSASENEEVLKGAEFDLFKLASDGTETQLNTAPIVTKEDGSLDIAELGEGYYKLVETKAPEGHLINTNPIFITVEDESHSDPTNVDPFTFKNYQSTIHFKKTDASSHLLAGATFNIYRSNEAGEKIGEPVNQTPLTSKTGDFTYQGLESGIQTDQGIEPAYYVLEEVTSAPGFVRNTELVAFTIEGQLGEPEVIELADFVNYQGSATILKQDDDKHLLAGAEFTVYDSDNKLVAKEVTTETGEATFTKLAPGTYRLKETKAPRGFILNKKDVSFTIAKESKGKPEVINLGSYLNYQGSAKLLKTDQTGKALTGAEFTVYDDKDQDVISVITDQSGQALFAHLAPGKYTVRETKAPAGYILNTTTLEFEVASAELDQPKVIELADFVNYQGSATILKQDDDKHLLAGAEFTVYDSDNKVVAKEMTTETGEATFTKLAPGTYTLKETKAPEGFILNKKDVSFTIAKESKGKPEVINLGSYLNYQGSAKLLKTDQTGKALTGAEFTVYDDKDQDVISVITDQSGQALFAHLAPGKYTVRETKAPAGYILNTTTLEFEVASAELDQPKVIELADFVNYQGSATLTKVDQADTQQVLSGAEFVLENNQGEPIRDRLVTDKDGKIHVKDLAPGVYYFVETKAPQGYQLSKEKLKLSIAGTAENEPAVQMLTMVNKKLPTLPNQPAKPGKPTTPTKPKGNLAQLGEKESSLYLGIGLSLMVIGSSIYRARKRDSLR